MIVDSVFESIKMDGNFNLIRLDYGQLGVENCIFNNIVCDNGTVLYLDADESTSVNIIRVVMNNCIAKRRKTAGLETSGQGGKIMGIDECEFMNVEGQGSGGTNGGALCVLYRGGQELKNSRFVNCHSSESLYGAIYYYNNNDILLIENCIFDSCSGMNNNGYSAGLLNVRGLQMKSCVFVNTLSLYGNMSSEGVVEGCTFREFSSGSDGGFSNNLIDIGNGIIRFKTCTFERLELINNSALSWNANVDIYIESCRFSYIIKEEGNGSGINCIIGDGKRLDIKDCTFSECTCLNGYGGAIYLYFNNDNGNNFELSGTINFDHNEAIRGNDIYLNVPVLLFLFLLLMLPFLFSFFFYFLFIFSIIRDTITL
jgi:hypothetical protein